MILSKMTWKDAEKTFGNSRVILLPIGSVEQHGPIGPLGTDYLIPREFAARLEERNPEDRILLPAVPYGVCPYHLGFPGTINIGDETLYAVIKGITRSLLQHGMKKFVFLNGHGGNGPALDKAALEVYQAGGLVAIVDWWVLAGQINPEWMGGHGAGQETSVMMAVDPSSVNKENCFPAEIGHLSEKLQNTHINSVRYGKGSVRIIRDVREVTSNGAYGGTDAPEDASAGTGKAILETLTEYMDSFVTEFTALPLKER
ncbi:MAG TPA: creatininase family protein [Synergistaceae bacterium]|nr:creatininase family protein [Synergistaceae bacterium]